MGISRCQDSTISKLQDLSGFTKTRVGKVSEEGKVWMNCVEFNPTKLSIGASGAGVALCPKMTPAQDPKQGGGMSERMG